MNPLEFRPLLKRIRWGGRRLGEVLGKSIGPESDYAESWEIADHAEDQSVVVDGEFARMTLGQLVQRKGDELFGQHAGLKQFPLLVKFLDAHDRLSVQVHPNDRQAKVYDPKENGKTEAWVIIEADPESRLYAGLKHGIDREQFAEHLHAGTVAECLHRFTVSPGDCVFIPAGTVHAIGEGIMLAEIQQQSDLTFRLFDWGRLGADGKPRALHIDEALACTDFERGPVDPVTPRGLSEPGREELVRSDYFVIERRRSDDPYSIGGDDRFHVVMCLDGAAEIRSGDDRRTIEKGRTVLVPAVSTEVEITPNETVTLLDAYLP